MSSNRVFLRLHKRKDIARVFRCGRWVRGDTFDLISLIGSEGPPRIAVVVPLHGMRAVDRNRAKRRIREALRRTEVFGTLTGDIVLRARPSIYGRSYREIVRDLEKAVIQLEEEWGNASDD
jgi:ribonuclease P protein component